MSRKIAVVQQDIRGQKRSRFEPIHIFTCLLATVTFLLWQYLDFEYVSRLLFWHSDTLETCSQTTREWQWDDIPPVKDLVWHECYKDLQCARLDVPLDWNDPSEDFRAVIAVIRLPATEKHDYKGPLFFNPGGPGGSGIQTIRFAGKALQQIVGTNHDLITFDPRGVGATVPRMDCFSSQQKSKIWALGEVGVIDSHPGVIYDAYARASAFADACTASLGGTSNNAPLKHVSTAATARDMLEILHKTGHEKLRYWGFSYGTVLGGTFAAMYPDKVERLVSDGNVDYAEWTTDTHIHFLTDADKVMDAFYFFCHLHGPSTCAFWEPSPMAVETRVERLLEKLRTHPVIVPAPSGSTELPEIVTYSSLKRLISAALYRPILMFSSVARIMAALEKGDGRSFVDYIASQGRTQFSCGCPAGDEFPGQLNEDATDDAFPAIMCTDGGRINETVEQFIDYAEELMKLSKSAGAAYSLFRMQCAAWKVEAKWRYAGPFSGNTSYPILYIANKADNVTPLRSAQVNLAGFSNSTLLIQDSYGHTTLSAPSICTAKAVRAYFQNGSVPRMNTTCPADILPFQEPTDLSIYTNDEDRELGRNLRIIAANILPLRNMGLW